MKRLINISIMVWFSFTASVAVAQEYSMKEKDYNNKSELFYIEPGDDWNTKPDQEIFTILGKIHRLNNTPQYTLKEVINEGQVSVTRYDQTINGVKLIGSDLIIRRVGLEVKSIIGVPRELIKGGIVLPSDSILIQISKNHLGEKNYLFEDTALIAFKLSIGQNPVELRPEVRHVYYPLNDKFDGVWVSCAEVVLETDDPGEYKVYINLENMNVIGTLANLHPANGTGTSLFSGNVNINTSLKNYGGGVNRYVLEDSINNIKTFDLQKRQNGPIPFTDPNNAFDSVNHKAAVEAHYNVQKVYEYFRSVHNWTSYDNASSTISNWVHFNVNEANAYWSNENKAMMFGDGDALTHPWVSLDICGHEFSHAIISRTAGLIYRGESGALNEGWADIFGASVEFHVRGASGNWALFEELQKPASGFARERYMQDPKNCSCPWKLPDTYKGDNWLHVDSAYDFGGVHFNSQVAAYWYYLLTVGGNGTNDKNNAYDVTGITRAKSEEIAFKALRMYMSQTSDYAAARRATLLYAEDKYGKNSNEYKQVCNAWYAVNVGEKCCGDSLTLEFDVTDATCPDKSDGEIDLTVKLKGAVHNEGLIYKWFKGDTTTAILATSQDLTGRDTGNYTVWVKDTVAKCEVVDQTKIEAPEPVKVSISGGGIHVRPCDRRPEIYLEANATGGTSPYTYNWGDDKQILVASEGSVGASGFYTAVVTDKNGCIGKRTAFVFFIPIVCSYDPNDIIGPPSYGDQKFVARSATLPYKIRFENDPKFATAPASRVTVDLPLDPNMEMNTFRVSSFGFNNFNFEVPNNVSSYYKRLDLRDSMGIYVDVTAGVNTSAKKAFWIFESIDPATGLPPIDGNRGFLPVNDTSKHNGEGYVDFTIRAKASTVTGDSLRALAEIVFDQNPSIFTPRIHNIIDAVAPTSTMDSLPYVMDSLEFDLSFKGTDDTGGSGVGTFDVYVSENKGSYTTYAQNLADSFIRFKGNQGSTYDFYTLAADNVMNREAAKNKPDLSLVITPRDFLLPLDSGLKKCVGDTLNISWKHTSLSNFNLEYTADTGKSYTVFASNVSAADTFYRWALPTLSSSTLQLRIRATSVVTGAKLDSTGTFELSASPAVDLGNDTFYCQGVSFSLTLDAGAGHSSYLWDDNSTSRTRNISAQGTYSVQVANSLGCKASDELTVLQKFNPTVSAKTVTNISCFGASDGAIDINIAGGKTPYVYAWSNANSTEDISGLAAGKYSLMVTDSFGCKVIDSTDISEPAKLLVTKNITHVKCKNGNDGAVDINVTGGTSPFNYQWSNSTSNQDISGLTAGVYSVVVTDARSCKAYDTSTVTEPALLVATHTSNNVNCKGGNDGSINLTVTGGSSPYTFQWSNSSGSEDISGLTVGRYTVIVTDINNCKAYDTIDITEPTLLVVSHTSQQVKCKNGNDGSIDLTVTGGVTPYAYLWSNSATTQDLSNISAGRYTVRVTDGNNCIVHDTIDIAEPTLLVSSHSQLDVKCKNGNDGSIDLTVSGGTSPYVYLWSNSATTQDISSLTAGRYTVLITDNNNCILRDTIDITEPTLLVASHTNQNVKCNNGNDGSIDLTVSGGVTPYVYLWSNSATTQDLSSLTAGRYSVRVTDANNCIVRDTVDITEPTLLVATHTFQNVKCKNAVDGSIDLTVSGGVTPYVYLWSNNATSQDLNNLAPGRYTVRITDANNCIVRDTIDITEPALLVVSHTSQNVKCKNGNDGSVDLTITGGTTPYVYLWSNSATTQDISSLTAGHYTVRITDANNCVVRDTIDITEPTLLVSSHTQQDVKCKNGNDGSIDLTVSGGVTPYVYLWSNSATTQDLSSLTAGRYTVRVTDANNCIVRDTVDITEPTLLVATHTFQNVKCKNAADGSIDLTVTGGVTPYVYLWSNSATTQDISNLAPGRYIVRITDGNNCIVRDTIDITEPALMVVSHTSQNVKCKNGNDGSIDLTITGGTTPYVYLWSNSATTQDISGLTAGRYTVHITDANNCVVRDTIDITEPTLLVSSHTHQDVKCKNGNDGSIDLTVSGGVTPYVYLWSNSATTQDLSSLTAGRYTVRVTDANNCIVRDTVDITEPTLLVATHTFQNVKCKNAADGSIDLTISGGVTPYVYLWSNSATTQDISNLAPGRYIVRITDANNCIVRDTVDITEPTQLVSSHTQQNVKCKNGNDGSIDLTVSGGTTPYVYLWNNSATTQDISGLTAGRYTVTITDNNNCILLDTVDITEPALLTVSHTSQNVKCKNGNDGSINLTIAGGVTPYTFVWSNSASTEDINTLTAGTYTVLVTDVNNCTVRDTVVITEPNLLTSTVSISNVLCHNGTDGSASVTINGGTTPYVYNWNTGEGINSISGKGTGTYILTTTDANLCVRKDTIFIDQPAAPLALTDSVKNVNCYGGSDGAINISPTGGTIPYQFTWSNSKITEDLINEPEGTYYLRLLDKNNCELLDTFTITQPLAPLTGVVNATHVRCFAGNDGAADLIIAGGTLPYRYVWNTSATTQDLTGLVTGWYKVIVTDTNNCIFTDSVFVNQPVAPLNSVLSETSVNCFGGTDGKVSNVVSGGTMPYVYSWSNGANTRELNGVAEGKYVVTITDANLCVRKDSIIVTQPAAPLAATLTPDDVNCFGTNTGGVSMTVSGGTPTYTFSWKGGLTSQNITSLYKGWYKVTITDQKNCTLTDSAFVDEPSALELVSDATSATEGDANGTAWTQATGATPPYSYQWNDSRAQEFDTARNLSIGTYIVTVIDAQGCTSKDTVVVELAPPPADIKMFPNPNFGRVTIVNLASLGLDEPITIELMDRIGKILQTYEVVGQDVFELAIGDEIVGGNYFIRVLNSRGVETRRFALMR